MPGYHYKRKGLAYGGDSATGGHHAGGISGEGTGAQGPAGGQSSQGNYGGGTSSNGESDSGGGLQSLSDIVGLYSKYSPTALAMRSLGVVKDAIEGFFGYEGGPAPAPTGNPNNPEGGGGGDILLAQQPLTNFSMQPMDPDQAYLDGITDPQQVRVIQFMEREGIYSPQQIRQYLDATARDVGLS